VIRIAAVADVHVGADSVGKLRPQFEHIGERADVLLIGGDLTRLGTRDEAAIFADEVAGLPVPIVAVLGNHDFHSGQELQVAEIFKAAGVHMLDGDAVEIEGIGFAGIKGFCGGFGARALGPWGEHLLKAFVQETIAEALKLETALARLRAASRVAVLHYSPVASTVEGEPLEIYPFLGSTRLEEPLLRYKVQTVLHGHAHHGQPEGRTTDGTPVYNVSLPLMQRAQPAQPFRRFELPRPSPGT